MPTNHSRMVRIFAPALIGGTVAVAAAGAANFASVAQGNARVGDIIAFEPAMNFEPDPDSRIVVHRPNQFGCVLDTNILRQSGGSMVIEARLSAEGRTFRIHWAGERTTTDSGDCGRSADLIVDHRDLDTLALAAGGYGLGRKVRPMVMAPLGS